MVELYVHFFTREKERLNLSPIKALFHLEKEDMYTNTFDITSETYYGGHMRVSYIVLSEGEHPVKVVPTSADYTICSGIHLNFYNGNLSFEAV
jgi:hypothetical protein